jgi:hypothetical protein
MKALSPAFKSWAIIIVVALLVVWLVRSSYPTTPPAPIDITWRPSAIPDNGLVMQVQNTGKGYLSCKMSVANLTQHQNQQYSFSLDPYKQQEIGILECSWKFEHGEFGNIKIEGYADKDFNVP